MGRKKKVDVEHLGPEPVPEPMSDEFKQHDPEPLTSEMIDPNGDPMEVVSSDLEKHSKFDKFKGGV